MTKQTSFEEIVEIHSLLENIKQEYTYLEQVVEISILECFVRAFQTPLES